MLRYSALITALCKCIGPVQVRCFCTHYSSSFFFSQPVMCVQRLICACNILVQQTKGKEDDGENKHCKSIETSRQTYVKEFRKVYNLWVNKLFLYFHQIYVLPEGLSQMRCVICLYHVDIIYIYAPWTLKKNFW